MGRIVGLLGVWLLFVMVGFIVEALFWLAMVGLVLFVTTGVLGAIKASESPELRTRVG